MLINKKITLCTLIEYDSPITESLILMEINKKDTIKFSTFNQFLKLEIDRIKVKHANLPNLDTIIEKVKKCYSIVNLRNNNLVVIDDGDSSISFVSYIYDMFSELLDSMKAKPITDRIFVNHLKYLDGLIHDSSKYNAFNHIEKERYIEDIHTFLRNVKHDFDKNRNVIVDRAENLSKFFEDDFDESVNKNKVMEDIVILCEKYIEPFYSFLMNFNPNSFIYRLKEFKAFFISNDFSEDEEISRFIIAYASYRSDIKNVYDRINDYRRKGKTDLLVYNAFEKEFNILNNEILLLQDGKKTKNHIESSEYHKAFNHFSDLKVNNIMYSDFAIEYIHLPERFMKIEDQFLMDMDASEINNDNVDNLLDEDEILTRIKQKEINHEITNFYFDLELKITNIISTNMNYLSKQDGVDLLQKIHHILNINIKDHKIAYTQYAYLILRAKLKNITIKFNKRNKIIANNRFYTYRPIYVLES